jgi:hypothetical protein
VSFPVGSTHAQLPLIEIDVLPLERHNLAASETRVAAEQDDEVSSPIELVSRCHELLVRLEVMKTGSRNRHSRASSADTFSSAASAAIHLEEMTDPSIADRSVHHRRAMLLAATSSRRSNIFVQPNSAP